MAERRPVGALISDYHGYHKTKPHPDCSICFWEALFAAEADGPLAQ